MALSEQEQKRFLLHRALEKSKYIYKITNGKRTLRNSELATIKEGQKLKLKKFHDLKTNFINEIEYSLTLEKFNLELMEKKNEAEKYEKYSKRASAFFCFISAILKENKQAMEVGLKELEKSIQEELLLQYKSRINYIRQRKAVFNRQKAYLMALKKESETLYENKKNELPTKIEMDNLDIEQYDLEKTIYDIESFFATNEVKIDMNSIYQMTLLDENIHVAANSLYPELEQAIMGEKSNSDTSDKKRASR